MSALALATLSTPALAQHVHTPGMEMPRPATPATKPAQQMEMDHSQMGHADSDRPSHAAMTGALGSYPMEREASGTAWQPDASRSAPAQRDGPLGPVGADAR